MSIAAEWVRAHFVVDCFQSCKRERRNTTAGKKKKEEARGFLVARLLLPPPRPPSKMYHTPVRPETWIGLGRWPDEKKRKEINGTHPEGEQELSGELKRMGRGKKTERVQKIFEEKCLIFPSTLLLSFFLSFFSPLLLQSCYWSGHGKRPPVPTVVAIPTGPCMFGSDSRVRVTAHLILVNRSWSPEHVGRENWKKRKEKEKERGGKMCALEEGRKHWKWGWWGRTSSSWTMRL